MKLQQFLNEKRISIDVYENPKGETVRVKKEAIGYVVDVDNRYDMFFQNKKKLKEWLKLHQMELVGTDIVNEATQRFVLQEYLFGWYDVKFFKTLKEAQKFAQRKFDAAVKRNKKAAKDWRPNAYGQEQIHAMRVVDSSVSPPKYYPGTKADKKAWTEQSKGYLQEAKKVVRVKKPDFMVAMGLPPDYSVKEMEPDVFQIAKFTHGKEPTEVYRCQWTGKQWKCNCYSRKGSCKHVTIVQKFIKGKKRNVFDKWAKEAIPKK